jgi:hypothetical protein
MVMGGRVISVGATSGLISTLGQDLFSAGIMFRVELGMSVDTDTLSFYQAYSYRDTVLLRDSY